jgi:hypothetical protein
MKRMYFKWQLGRPYFYPPWHEGLPTFRDWLAFELMVMGFAFKQYIKLGEQADGKSRSAPSRPRPGKKSRRHGTDEDCKNHGAISAPINSNK